MDRRAFLHRSAAIVAAGAAALPRLAAASSQAIKVRVAMFGASHSHAAGKLAAIRDLTEHFELIGVVEPDNKLQTALRSHPKYHAVPWLSETEFFAMGHLDAVLIETAVADQVRAAQRCIDAGWHVHLEKPGGQAHAALVRLFETAGQRNRPIQMGYMLRHNPAFEFCFRAIREGWLGRIFEASGSMSKLVDDEQRREFAQYAGGAMFELGCHLIDALLTMLGEPTGITPYNRSTRNDGVLGNQLAVFEYPQATATIRASIVEPYGSERRHFAISGENGTIEIRPLEPPQVELTLQQPVGGFQVGRQIVELPSAAGRYHAQLREFVAIIRGDHACRWTAEHDLAVHRAVLRASGVPVDTS
jgi:predicted dehydrogenase